MNSYLEPVALLKMKFCWGIFQGFVWKFQNTSFTEHLPYICDITKYVVLGLFKIIQNYVNNKINN